MSKEINKKIWRLTKVIYFIITFPLVFIWWIASLVAGKTIYYPWTNYSKPDFYIWILYLLWVILWYLIFTDLIRRIISYINNWKFKWFISYIEILKKYKIIFVILLFVITPTLIALSNNLSKECSWDNERFTDFWKCDCVEWYTKNNWICKITLEQNIINTIPTWSLLREYKELPWMDGTYMWIYIKDFTIKEVSKDEQPYSDCFWEIEWQWIEWEYHVFTFNNWKVTSDINIPLWFRSFSAPRAKFVFPFMNTKLNNFNYYWGEKPKNDSENYIIEETSLINFNDYNWDWIKQEFLLLDHWDQICGHNNYLVVWYQNQKAIMYNIKSKDFSGWFWEDNFIPNEKWEVVTWWDCWDHWAWTEYKKKFKFDNKKSEYILTSSSEKQCTEGAY